MPIPPSSRPMPPRLRRRSRNRGGAVAPAAGWQTSGGGQKQRGNVENRAPRMRPVFLTRLNSILTQFNSILTQSHALKLGIVSQKIGTQTKQLYKAVFSKIIKRDRKKCNDKKTGCIHTSQARFLFLGALCKRQPAGLDPATYAVPYFGHNSVLFADLRTARHDSGF